MNSNKGLIYLIQPAELLETERYKIGCSTKTDLSRCKNGYKCGSRYIIIMECSNPFAIENEIKKKFTSKFKLIAGKEYFEGNEEDIKKEFFYIISNFTLLKNEEPTIHKKKYECIQCHYLTSKKSSFVKHTTTHKHKNYTQLTIVNNKLTEKLPLHICKVCNKIYKSRVGLWKHSKICKTSEYNENIILSYDNVNNNVNASIINYQEN